VALGVRVFHGKSTVLWIGQVHVLDGNLEIIPVLYKNHFLFKQMEIQAKLLKTTTATGRRDVEAIEKNTKPTSQNYSITNSSTAEHPIVNGLVFFKYLLTVFQTRAFLNLNFT